jgi:hypothetical protein
MIEADRDKLVKILRMFGSDHDGEVAAAARRAHKILHDRSLDWDDLIISIKPARQKQRREHYVEDDEEADLIRKCAERNLCLTAWENEFVTSISASILEWGRLTPKQRAVLDRIVNKLKLAGAWEDI